MLFRSEFLFPDLTLVLAVGCHRASTRRCHSCYHSFLVIYISYVDTVYGYHHVRPRTTRRIYCNCFVRIGVYAEYVCCCYCFISLPRLRLTQTTCRILPSLLWQCSEISGGHKRNGSSTTNQLAWQRRCLSIDRVERKSHHNS